MASSRRFLAAVTLTFAIVACGGSDKAKDTVSGATSPLQDLFGGGDEYKNRQRKVEEATGTCMRDKGWKYVPVDFDKAFGQVSDNPELNDPDKFRDKYGYGISTSPDYGFGGNEFTDPNSAYVQSLSETEQQQYYKDLDGSNFGGDPTVQGEAPATTLSDLPAEPTGCRADAERSAGKSVFDDPKFNEVFGRLSEQFQGDQRYVDAEAKWAACMKDAGYSYSKVDEAVTDIQEQFMKLQGFDDGGFGPTPGDEVTQVTIATPVPIDGDGTGGFPSNNIDPAALKKIQDLEMATAKADGVCQKKHTDKVRKQLEQELADQLIAEFPELKK